MPSNNDISSKLRITSIDIASGHATNAREAKTNES